MLTPYRVLELCDEHGHLCGQILGDLGADVIQVEPPGGAALRRRGPFLDGRNDPEGSLAWWGANRNKRSIVLDLDTPHDRATALDLAATCDFVIESFAPGHLESRGLGYEAIRDRHPGVIYVSITPFGQSGPKAGYAATDLIVYAASGALALNGDDDRAPVRLGPAPQSFLHAGAEAAGCALAALHERHRSGLGQHVDISAQTAASTASLSAVLAQLYNPEHVTSRFAGGARLGPHVLPFTWKAKDGYVSLLVMFGSALGVFTQRLMALVCEGGFCDEATRDKDWIGYTELLLGGTEPAEEWQRVCQTIAACIASRTKAEWLEIGLQRGILVAPAVTIQELVESPQLASRNYFEDVEHEDLGRTVSYPGAFAKLSAFPMRTRRSPPRIGEHADEILEELGSMPPRVEGSSPSAPAVGGHSLDGLKVLDFTWVMAGPAATRFLADHGATVVRIESPTRVDTARTVPPHKRPPSTDTSAFFQNYNAGKLGLTLDLATDAAKRVVHDLVRWADVVAESFSPKAMKTWGLGYEDLLEIRPDLIMVSTCLMGQSGPWSKLAGFGTMGAAAAGFHEVTGWPDRTPAGLYSAYTDCVSPRFSVAALLAALEGRRRTGQGQYIDQSQIESTTHFLAPLVLDWTLNGHLHERLGNADPHMAPHGVYRAAGDDRWVAIACRDDRDWQALATTIGRADLAGDDELATLAGRQANEASLDEAVSVWTEARDAQEIERLLQQEGIPAHVVASSADFCADPQLTHRRHIVALEHSVIGECWVEGPRGLCSRTPASVTRPAPALGQHNGEVLREILGYDDDRITEMLVAGALG